MGFFDALGNIAGAASNISGIVGMAKGVSGLFGNSDQRRQIKQQKELMQYQNDLNALNSARDYQRQRDMTVDQYLLAKQGMRKAGINTAFADGSSAGAASVGSTSATTTPSALPTDSQVDSQYLGMINTSVDQIANLSLQRSQQNLINEQAENMRQRNLTQLQRDIVSLSKERAECKGQTQRNYYDKLLGDAESRYYQMNAANKAWILDDDATMKHLQSDLYGHMQNAELENLRQDYLNKLDQHDLNQQEKSLYEYKVKFIESQIEANKANAADSRSHVGVNLSTRKSLDATTENTKEDTKLKAQQHDFNDDSYSYRLNALKKSSVPDNMWQKIQMYRADGTFEKLDGFYQAGYSLYEALIASGVKPSDAVALAKLLPK